MYPKVFFSLCAINYCLGQSINSPPLDWIQTDGTGAYRFGYATGDEGRHYHVSAASADNTVAGRFGYKDPATGGDLQTTYTAGRRGFRARGPHIARRMDLSQNKPPFSRPNDDGQYHPELDNYFDPNEDRGYDFSYRTPDHIKEEHANRVGDVQGRYSYLDDIGFRHNVEYIAGAKTGFVVTNPVPDTFAQARGGPLYFVGKAGGAKVRGFSAVQKNLNGAYRFLASGPDHKRSEVSDASGNRRGVYTYLDDKGVQHTVEYIAGPKIGYKVINNRKGVSYNPALPYFPDSPTVQPLFPASSGGSGGGASGSGGGASGGAGSSGGSKPLPPFPSVPSPSFPSASSPSFPSAPSPSFPSAPSPSFPSAPSPSFPTKGDDLFTATNPLDAGFAPFPSTGGNSQSPSLPPTSSGLGSSGKPNGGKPPGDTSLNKPSTTFKPALIDTPSSSVPPFPFEQPGDFPSISPTFPSTSPFPIPAKPPRPDTLGDKWSYDFDYFFNDPTNSNKDWSKPIKGPSGNKVTSTVKPPTFEPFPDFSPSPFPEPSFLVPDSFNEGLNTAESGNGLKPPYDSQDKTPCTDNTDSSLSNKGDSGGGRGPKDRNEQPGRGPSFSGGGSSFSGGGSSFSGGSSSFSGGGSSFSGGGSSFSGGSSSFSGSGSKETKDGGAKHYYKGGKGILYPSRGTVKFGGAKKDWHKAESEEGYFSIPPGVAVRAHVQSLDIVPYKRFESPGEALKHHEDKREIKP